MPLKGVSTGQVMLPPRVVVYSMQGLGKTTFAASARRPIFLPLERGYDRLGPDRITSRPDDPGSVLESWDHFKRALKDVANQDHDYQTVVVDTADWLETLIHADVAATQEKPVDAIEDIGYGKGYLAAMRHWGTMLSLLDECVNRRHMAAVVLAHATVRRHDSPEVEPYDRYTLKLHESKGSGGGNATAKLVEWADVVGFIRMRETIQSTDVGFKKMVNRGKSSGNRELCVSPVPAYAAKNRYGITKPISLPEEGGWMALEQAMLERAARKSVKDLVAATIQTSAEQAVQEDSGSQDANAQQGEK